MAFNDLNIFWEFVHVDELQLLGSINTLIFLYAYENFMRPLYFTWYSQHISLSTDPVVREQLAPAYLTSCLMERTNLWKNLVKVCKKVSI